MHVDRTTKFTLCFLDAIEKRLAIQWTSDGAPVFLPEEVNHFSFQMLRRDLADLCRSSLLQDAILDMETCQRDHQILQSTGVGLAPDFDLFSKLGLLLGDRLVLWDTVVQGSFAVPDHHIEKISFGSLACSLLLLKRVAEHGGVVLLPHPTTWLERARYYFARAAQEVTVGTEFLGFLNARSLLDEGIALHPYSVSTDRKRLKATKTAVIGDEDMLQDEAMDFHANLMDLIQDENFLLLREVSIDAFHTFLGPRNYRRKLRELISSVPSGLSEIQKVEHLGHIRSELRKTIDTQNRDTALRRVSITGAALGATAASIALLHDATSSAAFLSLLTGAMGTMAKWIPFCEKLFSQTKTPTLYQVFQHLERDAENELVKSQTERWRNLESFTEMGIEP